MNLTQNTQYEAQLSLTGMETFATNGMIAAKLTEAGFSHVTVSGGGSKRTAKGKWAKATQANVELPKQVLSIKAV